MPTVLTTSVLAAVLTLFVAGCSGSKDSKETAPSAAPPKAIDSSVNALARDRVQEGGRLTWPMHRLPSNYNANQVDSPDATSVYVPFAIMPRPFGFDPDGTPRWSHDLFASEPTVVTNPQQVITYRINPKARWNDGTPITWQDFYWQWKSLNGTNKEFQIAAANGYEDVADVVKGQDDREVVVTYKHKYADWQGIFDPLYPASMSKSPKAFNDGWRSRPLVTGGPFKFDHIDETAKTVTLVRNEKWWGEPAKLDAIVFRAIDQNAHIDALANGEVDLIDIGPDANVYNRAKAISGVDIRVAAGPNFRHITINGTGPILKDVAVRRALAMAINREALARAILGPLGINPAVLNNHIFMANQAGYRDNSGEIGKYNPTKSKELLEQSGWKIEGNIRKKAGQALEITCVIPSANTTSRQESELVQNMLAQVGITMKINTVPTPDFFSKYVNTGQFDLTFFSWQGTPFPISSVRSIYVNPKPGPDGVLAVEQNFARVGSDELDKLIAQAIQELEPSKAIELANRADALIWQEVHSLPLYQRPELWAVKKDLANMGALGMAWQYPVFQNIGWAKH